MTIKGGKQVGQCGDQSRSEFVLIGDEGIMQNPKKTPFYKEGEPSKMSNRNSFPFFWGDQRTTTTCTCKLLKITFNEQLRNFPAAFSKNLPHTGGRTGVWQGKSSSDSIFRI